MNPNPVYEAYRILLEARDNNDIEAAMIAIEEAIGYLGQALDD